MINLISTTKQNVGIINEFEWEKRLFLCFYKTNCNLRCGIK